MAKAALEQWPDHVWRERFVHRPEDTLSARYFIRSGKASEAHSSSGVIVSTGMGSTGWLEKPAHRCGCHRQCHGNRGKKEQAQPGLL
jgi:hypothetical protein